MSPYQLAMEIIDQEEIKRGVIFSEDEKQNIVGLAQPYLGGSYGRETVEYTVRESIDMMMKHRGEHIKTPYELLSEPITDEMRVEMYKNRNPEQSKKALERLRKSDYQAYLRAKARLEE
jgi:hypothetical protein